MQPALDFAVSSGTRGRSQTATCISSAHERTPTPFIARWLQDARCKLMQLYEQLRALDVENNGGLTGAVVGSLCT